MSENDAIRNVTLLGGTAARRTNAPKQYSGRQKQYGGDATALFYAERAKYATDFVDAQVQGLVPGDFYAWRGQKMRISDTIKQGASLTRKTDDQKEYLLADRGIDYIPEGAKIETMGSTWLATNPSNLSSVAGSGIMRRCNATWNHLDWYGRVRKEPILVEKQQAMATANEFQGVSLIMQGYFNIICQKNPETDELDQNSRLILGRRAFQITGYSDVTQEFTGEDESTHLLYFAARIQEPDETIDDLARRVAGGKTFSWEIRISGATVLRAGETAQMAAESIRCGEAVADEDGEHPVSYFWETSDETVARVDAGGLVTAVGAGGCTITARLAQNPEIESKITLSVADAESGAEVRFLTEPPEMIGAYDAATLRAAYYEGGAQKDHELTWEISGASEEAYTAAVIGNQVTVQNWGGSETPLTVTAKYGNASVSASIRLEAI